MEPLEAVVELYVSREGFRFNRSLAIKIYGSNKICPDILFVSRRDGLLVEEIVGLRSLERKTRMFFDPNIGVL